MRLSPDSSSSRSFWIEDLLGNLVTLAFDQDPLVIASSVHSTVKRDGALLRVSNEGNGQLLFHGQAAFSAENLNARYLLASGKSYFPRISLELVSERGSEDLVWFDVEFFDSEYKKIGVGSISNEIDCAEAPPARDRETKLHDYLRKVFQPGEQLDE